MTDMQKKLILCLNAGSSSVKFALFNYEAGTPLLLEGAINGITADKQFLDFKSYAADGSTIESIKKQQVDAPEHDTAFKYFMNRLDSQKGSKRMIDSLDDIYIACHRIVHGGANPRPLIIDDSVSHELEMLSDLAPLHNQRALDIVHSCRSHLENTKNVAFFDSSFHMKIERAVYTFPISLDVQKRHQLRKYGFHGLSYAFIASEAAAYLQIDQSELNIIALHLGSGASACAIANGVSVNTSMGLTPLEGLPGATRSGSIDPSLIFHYHSDSSRLSTASSKEMKLTVAEDILNKQSGWQSITGTTDFGIITKRALYENDENCKLAFDMFVNRVSMYVGQYWVALKGKATALVFAGGIGERGAELRGAVVDAVSCLGFELDEQLNKEASKSEETVFEITKEGARLKILIVHTDEQKQMAKEVLSREF
ncbi:Acetokinase family-domain-containing protein [Kockiozyma suomiensis]|uniref:Acetokinase family-domain-containing protein n=1 Tax=Kockiozyma suomiensis TaxID=1337062 RepID=UPI003343A409